MNDPIDPHTEDQLRRALGQRAQETTVSPDALDNIRNRRPGTAWGRTAVYAGVAAALALLVGVAVWNISGDDDPIDVVEDPVPTTTVAIPTTTMGSGVTDEPEEPTTTPSRPPTPEPGPTPERFIDARLPASPVDYAWAGAILWPRSEPGTASPAPEDAFPTPEAAAESWAADGLGVAEPILRTLAIEEVPWGTTWVRAFALNGVGEDGLPTDFAVTQIITASTDGGETWVVTHSGSDEFQVTLVEQNTPDTLRISGLGRAFEGSATLRVGDADPVLISVGGGEFGTFSVVVPAPASYPVPIIVQGDVVLENAIPQTHAFAAFPDERDTDIAVFGVAADDVLNVRSGPGVGNDVVGTFAPDATGIAHTGAEEVVGGDTWWEVTDGTTTGWANRLFLSVQHTDRSIEDLDLTGNPILQMFGEDPGDNAAMFASTVWIGGIGVYADAPSPWTPVASSELDTGTFDFCPEGLDQFPEDCELTVSEFLGVDTAKWELAEVEPVPDINESNFGTSSGLHPDFYERFTTSTIYIPEPNPDVSLDWRRYTIVWGFDDGAPQVEGIWRWGWTP